MYILWAITDHSHQKSGFRLVSSVFFHRYSQYSYVYSRFAGLKNKKIIKMKISKDLSCHRLKKTERHRQQQQKHSFLGIENVADCRSNNTSLLIWNIYYMFSLVSAIIYLIVFFFSRWHRYPCFRLWSRSSFDESFRQIFSISECVSVLKVMQHLILCSEYQSRIWIELEARTGLYSIYFFFFVFRDWFWW